MMSERFPLTCETLTRSIGEISDSYVQEAISYRPASKRKLPLFPLVAALVLVAALALNGTLLSTLFRKLSSKDTAPGFQQELYPSIRTEADLVSFPVNLSLQQSLSLSTGTLSFDTAPSFPTDGTVRIVWKAAGDSSRYEAIELSTASAALRLENALSQTPAARVSPDAASENALPVSLWIVLSDGSVVTPYLESSPGNTGYGSLYDYSPEVIPAEAFAELLRSLIASEQEH